MFSKAKAVTDAAESAACEEAQAAAIKETFAVMARDPVRRKQEARKLRQRFDIGYVESEDYPRVCPTQLQSNRKGRRLANSASREDTPIF